MKMYVKLIPFVLWITTEAALSPTLIVADENGLHMRDANNNSKTILLFSQGVNDFDFNFERKEVYAIIKLKQPMNYKIVRTKFLEAHERATCTADPSQEWCFNDQTCPNICNYPDTVFPELIFEPENCLEARNLVLDSMNNIIYYSCQPQSGQNSTINMVTTDWSETRTIASLQNRIQSIAIDSHEKKLFILEASTLKVTALTDDTIETILQVSNQTESMLKISLDTQNKIIYVLESISSDDKLLAKVDYKGSGFQKLYLINEPSWDLGPTVFQSVLYWRTKINSNFSWSSVDESKTVSVQMKRISVGEKVNQWKMFYLEEQLHVNETSSTHVSHSSVNQYSAISGPRNLEKSTIYAMNSEHLIPPGLSDPSSNMTFHGFGHMFPSLNRMKK